MQRLSRLFALMLLTVWLPVTQHCNLEAAGLVGKTRSTNSTPGRCAVIDGCDLVKNGNFGVKEMKVLEPTLVACPCLLCVRLVSPTANSRVAILPVEAGDPPLSWVPSWQFVRRAAPAPRAPAPAAA